MKGRRTWAVGLSALALWACEHTPVDRASAGTTAAGSAAPPVTLLEDSLAPLQAYFNEARGRRRFVALLSPTCQACLDGAQAIHRSILPQTERQRWALALIWVFTRPTDDPQAAEDALERFAHPRVHQFVDPDRRAGWAFTRSGFPSFNAPAWNVYLFYDERASWTEKLPPAPLEWLAQFRGPGGRPTVARSLDEDLRPVPLGPATSLPRLLLEQVRRLDGR